MRIPITQPPCEWDRCLEQAQFVVSGRTRYPGIRYYCAAHADLVIDDDNPEYTVTCPNCECRFGVN